ncbi:Very-long-chain enoyl-CoA reductase [Thecaphora frezii]
MSFTVTVSKRGPSPSSGGTPLFPLTLTLPTPTPTLETLKKAISAQSPRLTPPRQRITTADKKPLLDDHQPLPSLGVRSGDTLYLKDLGPQVGWTTVFFTEYAGPLWIHPVVFAASASVWRQQFVPSRMQKLALAMVLAHYAKRELETLLVHRFSNGTMPLFNLFKNSFHYWILSGLLLAVGVYSPYYSQPRLQGTLQDSNLFLFSCLAVFVLAELSNAYCHLLLSWLRPPGTRVRKIPRGFAFTLVSCPNYTFEILAWIAFTVMTLNPAAAVFAAVSTAQMAVWAVKKHRAYKKEFGKEYPKRKVLVPFVW